MAHFTNTTTMYAQDERSNIERAAMKKREYNYSTSSSRREIPPPHIHTQSRRLQPEPPPVLPSGTTEYIQRASESSGEFNHFITEHEIKFTKRQVCSPSTCICFFIAILFSFMALLSGIYYGLNFFDGKHLKERVFKAQFVAHNQEFLANSLEYSDSKEFKIVSDSLKQKIDQVFKESTIGKSYIRSEIVAFERKRNSLTDVIIHFNVHISANKQNVDASDVYLVLAEEILNNKQKTFENLTIDHGSIDVQERKWTPREKSDLIVNPWTYKSIFPGMLEGLSTEPTPAPRKCAKIGLSYCNFLPYNYTSYPNALNHWNMSSVEEEFISYKEIIDSECYSLAKEFICSLLQPECIDDEMILPCRRFCTDFYTACQRWLPTKVSSKIVCSTFPEHKVRGKRRYYECRNKPNCAVSLRLQGQSTKLCDGIVDCDDGSDESSCDYCNSSNQFYCGNKQCVSTEATCDGIKDCQNGADEMNCLRLFSLTGDSKTQKTGVENEGFVRATYKGKHSYVCSDTSNVHNYTTDIHSTKTQQILGLNICNENQFEQLIHIESKHLNINGPFTKFVPGTTLISPYSIQCKNKQIYYVQCALPKCGLTSFNLDYSLSHSNSHQALPGYWPWFAKVNLNGNYHCDGTLVSVDSVLVQSTCPLLSQHSSQWNSLNVTVTLGSVRLFNDNREASRYVMSHITTTTSSTSTSPASTDWEPQLSLIKLSKPVDVSHYIRPICHNGESAGWINTVSSLRCAVLGLNYELDQLQWKVAKIVNMDKCTTLPHNTSPKSITANLMSADKQRHGNKLCVEVFDNDTDHGDTLADNIESCHNCSVTGRHLYCSNKHSWHLYGLEHRMVVPSRTANTASLIIFQMVPKLSL